VDGARCFIVVTAIVSLVGAGCGSDRVSEPSSDSSSVTTAAPDATTVPDATIIDPPTTGQDAVQPTSTASLPPAPATLAPAPVDLLDPAAWIGHRYAEEEVADPFQHVILDGSVTHFITMRYGTTSEPDPIGFPAFVRPDPGGYGYSGTEPGPWVVLAWQPADPMNQPAGGPVTDALLTSSVEGEMPMSGCRSNAGEAGVYLGFVVYDPTYVPDGTETAPFPVTKAWRIADDLRLEPIAADGVECDWYEFGD